MANERYQFEYEIESAFDEHLAQSGVIASIKGDTTEQPNQRVDISLTLGQSVEGHDFVTRREASVIRTERTHYSGTLTIDCHFPLIDDDGVPVDYNEVLGAIRERMRDYWITEINARLGYHEIAFILPQATATQADDQHNMSIQMQFQIEFRIRDSAFA